MIKKLKLKAGKAYQIFDPSGYGQKKERVHIEHIMPHHSNSNIAYSIITYRVWMKNKRYWAYFAKPYYTFAMYNDWEWK